MGAFKAGGISGVFASFTPVAITEEDSSGEVLLQGSPSKIIAEVGVSVEC